MVDDWRAGLTGFQTCLARCGLVVWSGRRKEDVLWPVSVCGSAVEWIDCQEVRVTLHVECLMWLSVLSGFISILFLQAHRCYCYSNQEGFSHLGKLPGTHHSGM